MVEIQVCTIKIASHSADFLIVFLYVQLVSDYKNEINVKGRAGCYGQCTLPSIEPHPSNIEVLAAWHYITRYMSFKVDYWQSLHNWDDH